MRKIILTVCAYDLEHPMLNLFNTHIKPRIDEYCLKHGFEFIVLDKFQPYHRDWSWAKIQEAQRLMLEMDNGDLIVLMDADSIIMDSEMSLIFEKDIAIAHETTGCLCMGLMAIKVSDFSRKFVDAMCDEDRHEKNKHTSSWQIWHENDAIYHICGINWGEQPDRVGTRDTTPFTIEELKENVLFLAPEYNVTFNPEDIETPLNAYANIEKYARKERFVKMNNILIRHLAGGMIYEKWAEKYFNYKMR